MTLPASPNSISMSQVNAELSKAASALVSINDGDVRLLAGKASGAISMGDLRGKSAVNYGSITSNYAIRAEGQSFTFTLSGGTAVPNGTYYWKVETISNMDVTDFSATSGSFTISSNTGSFTVTTVNDALNEGNGTFRVLVGDASGVPVTYVTGPTVTVTETVSYTASVSNANPYRFGAAAAYRDVKLTVNTTQVANSTVLYWDIFSNSGTVDTSDVSAVSGSLTISSNTGSATVTVVEVTNGSSVLSESFQFRIFSDAGRTNLLTTSPQVTIRASPTFSISFSPTSIAEGGASTMSVTTTNVPTGSTLYYTLSGTGAAADILGLAASGSLTLSSSTVSSTWWAALDGASESTETITFQGRTVSTAGAIVASGSLSITNALGSIGTVTASRTGGATAGSAISIFVSATGIPAYGQDRTFSIEFSLNGGAWTTAGLEKTSVTLLAGGTSIPSTRCYYAAGGGAINVTSLKLRLSLTGHNTAESAGISGFYI